METWVDIKGYEGLYQVSNMGRVMSKEKVVNSRFGHRKVRERILSITNNASGYKHVAVSKEGKCKVFRLNRLVAIHFIPNPNNLPEVNHIDGNKANNCESNLEWNSVSENRLHAYRTGLNKHRRLNEDQVIEILNSPKSKKELSIEYGVSIGCIKGVVNRKNWVHLTAKITNH